MMKFDLSSIFELPILTRILLALLVCSGFFYFGNKMDTKYLRSKLINAKQTEAELKNEISVVINKQYQINAEISNFPLYHAELNKWKHKLINYSNLPELLNQILKAASENGLRVVFFNPETAKTDNTYFKIPIKIVAEGGYHQISGFISQVANMSSIVVVKDFIITSKKKNELITSTKKPVEQMNTANLLQLQIYVDVYYLKESQNED